MDAGLEIIYLDHSLVVINKPPGLLSLPDGHDPSIPHVRTILEPEFGKLWIVHRLDKETSGVIILARDQESHSHINNQFANHTIEKVYHAIIHGKLDQENLTINSPLRSNVGRKKRSAVDPIGGKSAITEIQILERFTNTTLVEAKPKTGRTHQIRVHLYSIGHPILADNLYGYDIETSIINRLALHALSIKLIHPGTGREISFKSQYFQDFKNALSILRNKDNRIKNQP